jgi:hypothetical protein
MKLTASWVRIEKETPPKYEAVQVIAVVGGELVKRVARLNKQNTWELAGFRADSHKYQYSVEVTEWLKIEEAQQLWPNAKDVGRLDDMHVNGHLRVGLDSDNDVYVSVYNGDSSSNVEFCNTGGNGGGRSPNTRKALIDLMLAIEADNKENPKLDWWRR